MKRLLSMHVAVLLVLGIFVLVAPAQERKLIKAGLLNGKAKSLPKPEYPAEARAAGLDGSVWVDVEIDEEGNVVSAVARTDLQKRKNADGVELDVPPADVLLRDSAEKAAMNAKFSPTLLSGEPVRVKGTIVYNFVHSAPPVPKTLSGGIVNGKAYSLPQPVYPAEALAVRAAGSVVVQVLIDEGGNVISATAVSGHPLLRAAAVEAAKEAKFAPTRLSGQPVKVAGVITYNFVAPTTDSN